MRVIVIGPKGKMGKLITQVAAEREDLEADGGVGPKGRDYIGADLGTVAMVGRELGVPVTDDLESVIDNCDVIIDFSTKRNGYGRAGTGCGTWKGSGLRYYRIYRRRDPKVQRGSRKDSYALCGEYV